MTNQSAPCLEFAKSVACHDAVNVWITERTADNSCWGNDHGRADVWTFDHRD
jgi:hypothetical protein